MDLAPDPLDWYSREELQELWGLSPTKLMLAGAAYHKLLAKVVEALGLPIPLGKRYRAEEHVRYTFAGPSECARFSRSYTPKGTDIHLPWCAALERSGIPDPKEYYLRQDGDGICGPVRRKGQTCGDWSVGLLHGFTEGRGAWIFNFDQAVNFPRLVVAGTPLDCLALMGVRRDWHPISFGRPFPTVFQLAVLHERGPDLEVLVYPNGVSRHGLGGAIALYRCLGAKLSIRFRRVPDMQPQFLAGGLGSGIPALEELPETTVDELYELAGLRVPVA